MLDSMTGAIRDHIVLPVHAAETAALWAVHCHIFDATDVTPRLALLSPHKRCGKTTLLGVLSRLVPRPLLAANVTAAAVFRTVEAARPVLLADEADNFLGRDEMLGILNRGHRRGGRVIRTVGDDREPRQFSTFAPAALAAIGRLPPTLQGRSIAVLARALPIPSA
ncbi:MAG: hypothetical protein GWO40_19315 [Gammaproteobacteria bacterium]|nr:hypothetical protein [Gammaproteobacteria bacterium]NIX87670.1 hypothetical protein [Gammaproteobacteria bacterium]